jgi:ribosomal protein L40E
MASMKSCVKCYAENDEGVQICRACGSKEFHMENESKLLCPHCGQGNKEGDKECYACGHSLGGRA